MHLGMMTSVLLFIMSMGYLTDGIIPILIGKILLLKAKLLLGPPIALGAFVVGQGSGLLIGKILAVRYILKKWRNHNDHHHQHYHYGWKLSYPIHTSGYVQPYGWQPQLPSYHHSNSYGGQDYESQFQYGDVSSGYTPQSYTTSHYSAGTLSPYSSSSGGYYDHSTPYAHYGSSSSQSPYKVYSSSDYYNSESESPSAFESGGSISESYYNDSPRTSSSSTNINHDINGQEYANAQENYAASESRKVQEVRPKPNRKPNVKTKPPPSAPVPNHPVTAETSSESEEYIIEQFLKPKNNSKLSEEKKLDTLAELLRNQFHQEFINFFNTKNSAAFSTSSPLPTNKIVSPISTTLPVEEARKSRDFVGSSEKPKKATSKTKKSKNSVKKLKSSEDTTYSNTEFEEVATRKPIGIHSSILEVFSDMKASDLVPDSLMSWLFESNEADSVASISHAVSRKKREAPPVATPDPEFDLGKVADSFAQDVKSLFSIVSFLDINRCLEKMVCEIHSKRVSTSAPMTEYEKNIITAFRIMDTVMPLETSHVDSTTKYRQAAALGQSVAGGDICVKSFQGCGFSTQHIITLGNIAVPVPTSSGNQNEEVADFGRPIRGYSPLSTSSNREDMDSNSGV